MKLPQPIEGHWSSLQGLPPSGWCNSPPKADVAFKQTGYFHSSNDSDAVPRFLQFEHNSEPEHLQRRSSPTFDVPGSVLLKFVLNKRVHYPMGSREHLTCMCPHVVRVLMSALQTAFSWLFLHRSAALLSGTGFDIYSQQCSFACQLQCLTDARGVMSSDRKSVFPSVFALVKL